MEPTWVISPIATSLWGSQQEKILNYGDFFFRIISYRYNWCFILSSPILRSCWHFYVVIDNGESEGESIRIKDPEFSPVWSCLRPVKDCWIQHLPSSIRLQGVSSYILIISNCLSNLERMACHLWTTISMTRRMHELEIYLARANTLSIWCMSTCTQASGGGNWKQWDYDRGEIEDSGSRGGGREKRIEVSGEFLQLEKKKIDDHMTKLILEKSQLEKSIVDL